MKVDLTRSQTATGAGTAFDVGARQREFHNRTFQASVTGTGAVTATVVIQVSNDSAGMGWLTLGTITLSGTTTATDGFSSDAPWESVRSNVTAISGTGATVIAVMGA